MPGLPNTKVFPPGWADHVQSIIEAPMSQTTFAILRGTATDGYGDVADVDTVVQTGIAGSIIGRDVTAVDAATGQPKSTRVTVATIPAGTDIRVGDRVKDLTTAVVYTVTSFYPLTAPLHTPGIHLDLARAYERTRTDV